MPRSGKRTQPGGCNPGNFSKSETALKGRKISVLHFVPSRARVTTAFRPVGAGHLLGLVPGVKTRLEPQAQSLSPLGTIARLKLHDVDGADVGGLQGGLQDRVGRK